MTTHGADAGPRHLLVLGAGTAGTTAVNKLRRRLPKDGWDITIVDPSPTHYYQPGYLFLPFDGGTTKRLTRPTSSFIPSGVTLIEAEVDRVVPERRSVVLTDGRRVGYDYLVIATGVTPRPDLVPGLVDGGEWRRSIHDFYTFAGALALRRRLAAFEAGRLVVHVAEMPVKCPVAPLEFAFLADDFLRRTGRRGAVEIVYVTPLSGAFTKPVASAELSGMLERRGIALESDFMVERVDADRRTLVSYDEREIPFDLLVTVPPNLGADFVARSGLGDELQCVPVDRHTMRSTAHDSIFAVGDAANLPTSKAGSVAHFAVDVFVDNFVELAAGRPMTHTFDGHANCYVESGGGKAMLIDFNYDVEPLPGTFPVPGVGPFRLLRETRLNHWGKRAFRWVYWHVLLRGRPLPVPSAMSMAGKHQVEPGPPRQDNVEV